MVELLKLSDCSDTHTDEIGLSYTVDDDLSPQKPNGYSDTQEYTTSRFAFGRDDSIIRCRLETEDLWNRFRRLGLTEMIITKAGRYVRQIRLYDSLPTVAVATESAHPRPPRIPKPSGRKSATTV